MLYHSIMKNFDVFLNKVIKSLLVVNIIIMLTIVSFFVQPVFAEQLNDMVFTGQPLPVGSSSDIVGTGINIYVAGNSYFAVSSSEDSPVYVFAYQGPSYPSICYVSESSTVAYSTNEAYPQYYTTHNINNNSFLSDYNFYYASQGLSRSDVSFFIPYYSTIDEGIEALRNYIDNSSIPRVSFEGLRIPSGYFARIELSEAGSSFNVNTKMPVVSGNSAVYPWPDSSQVYLPSVYQSPSQIEVSSMSAISWLKAGTLSTLGQTYSARAVLSGNLRYVWIYNPIQMKPTFVSDTVYYAPNGPIILTNTNDIRSVRLYAATAYLTSNEVSSNDDEYYDAVVTEGGISWTNENGDTSVPPDGGGNTPAGDPKSLVDQFKDILSDLVGRIEQLLVAPVSYIQRIIVAGDTFFSWLSGLWSWLPAPVSGIITSVLYVMAVVGALKLLWR